MERTAKMKNLNYLNYCRQWDKEKELCGTNGDSQNGIFRVFVGGKGYNVIASNGGGWDHVSVTPTNVKRGCPSWETMCAIKDMFFEKHEAVIEYHPEEDNYINVHPCCLHLWRPQNHSIPMPPKFMV